MVIVNKNVTRKIENKGISIASVTIKLEKLINLPEAKQKNPDNHAVSFEVNSILLMSQTDINGININIAWIKNNIFIPSSEHDVYVDLLERHNKFS